MSTVEGKKQEKRRALLDAAYELFLERGTAKTSVEDITSRAKVAKGTFYLYFQDKGAVMQALLGRVSYQLLSDACEAVEKQTELENFPDMYAGVNSLITKPAISFANSAFLLIAKAFGYDTTLASGMQSEWAKQGV